MGERDNFSRSTIQSLRDRAGNVCSICHIGTSGAELGGPGVVNVGVAAHITAAAPGGPRYDARLSPEQRRHQDNGIWLCQVHGKQIDADPIRFTVELLRAYKRDAEARSARAIFTLSRRPELEPLALEPQDRAALAALGTDEEHYADRLALLRHRAAHDLHVFRRQLKVPDDPAALRLQLLDGERSACAADGLAAVLAVFSHVTLVAPPGTGKTTAALITAERLLTTTQSIAIFVPLNEWTSLQRPLLDSILRRRAFDGLHERDLKAAAIHGQLTLVLDGWNELDERARRFARSELQQLMRDFPRLGTLISTRQRSRDVPTSGMTVLVEPLDREAQLHLARTVRAEDGVRLLEQARGTPGLREFISTPLYLMALLAHAQHDQLPQTREQLLRLFVAQHEQIPAHHEALHSVLAGCHTVLLESLAVQATHAGITALTDTAARAAVRVATDALLAKHQISIAPQPETVITALVNHHALIVPGESSVAFQHQQFQEFYAATYVEKLLSALHAGAPTAAEELRTRVLNEYAWEESILFACERLSRADAAGASAIATAVREALTIDPMLAASMIHRASDVTWRLIANDVMAFARRWLESSARYRAVRFMISTGRAEFSGDLWPLIGAENHQVSFRALRAADPFIGSALGDDWRPHLDQLSRKTRERVLHDLTVDGDYTAIEIAARYAAGDPDEGIQGKVIEALLFRGAGTLLAEVFANAPEDVWVRVARHGYAAQDANEPSVADRLRRAQAVLDKEEVDPRQRLRRLLIAEPNAENAAVVQTLLQSDDFDMDREIGQGLAYEAHSGYPEAVVSALLERVRRGLPLPWRADEMLRASECAIDDGAIPTLLLQDIHARNTGAAAAVVGPRTVSRMLELLAELHTRWRESERNDEVLRKDLLRIQDLIGATSAAAFVPAVLAVRAETPEDVARLAGLVANHGLRFENRAPLATGDLQAGLAARLIEWSDMLLHSENTRRSHIAELAGAMGRLTDTSLAPHVLRLLSEETRRWRIARATFAEARRRGDRNNDAQMSYSTTFVRALSSIAGPEIVTGMVQLMPDPSHEGFGIDAAQVLLALWMRESQEHNDSIQTPFARVRTRREEMLRGERAPMHPLTQPILDVIQRLIGSSSAAEQAHALRLAAFAFRLPYGDQTDLIAQLMAFGQPIAVKQGVLSTLILAGEVVQAAMLLEGIRDLLERARTSPWLLQPDQGGGWELRRWLELLSLSDRPTAALEAIELLPERWRSPRQLECVLSALGDSPDDTAEAVLLALAERDARFASDRHWTAAMASRKTRTATRALLSAAIESAAQQGRTVETHYLAQLVARDYGADEASRAELRQMYNDSNGALAHVLERALVESIDAEGVLALVRRFAAEGRHVDRTLWDAVEGVATRREPSADFQGAYEIVPATCQSLRRALMEMVIDGGAEARVAAGCLTVIDELRDAHGAPAGETRHPSIQSGKPWPIV